MYKLVTREDTIRIPAEYIRKGQSLNQHIDRLASTSFEGRYDEENNFILVTYDHEPIGRGRIIHGDGAIYQPVKFKAVLYCLEDHEIMEGGVSEVQEIGAFIRIGPQEALLHISQIMDDKVSVNMGMNRIEGTTTGKALGEGAAIRARIVSISYNTTDPRASRIGLTCRQPGLGALDWLLDEQEEG